jgi:hypothetical protein
MVERNGDGELAATVPARRPLWKRTWVRVVAIVLVAGLIVAFIAAEYVATHMAPLLKHAVIDAIEDRFHETTELDDLHVSVINGLEVQGRGLRLLPAPNVRQPLVKVDSFSFHTSFDSLLHRRAHVSVIHMNGVELHVPPHSMHVQPSSGPHAAVKFTADEIICENALLVIDTDKPGKQPREFEIQNLVMHDVGPAKPAPYEVDLINPKPRGDIHATGHFGPWNAASPRDTAVDGHYSFTHADLSTIKGIRGILNSTGDYQGTLGDITVDGVASVPDFALEGRGHSERLDTKFHAYVDGTTGDVRLDPVFAKLGNSPFTTSGSIVRIPLRPGEDTETGTHQNIGHQIDLNINMPHGRIEDLLQLAVKADQPLMRGAVTMQAKLHIPPGHVSVVQKMELAGTVTIHSVEFTNKGVQDKIDGMSMRAQGKPEDAKQAGSDHQAQVASEMMVNFVMAAGMLKANSLHYQLPGANIDMVGVYATESHRFNFEGHVRTDAKASEMITGWKSKLIKPFDGLFAKNGAGLQLPISVSGANGDFSFGLHDGKLTADQMADNMRKAGK